MKNSKLFIALFSMAIILSTSCKKEKIQTQLPAEYSNQGTINVVNKNISICIYDNSVEDGDIVDLIFNGKALVKDYELKIAEKCFHVSLEKGNNWIGVIAKNEGTNPPASVTVKVDDGSTEQEFDIDGEIDKPGGYIIKL